jgi:hypothetical protein
MAEALRLSSLALFAIGPVVAAMALLRRGIEPSPLRSRIRSWRWYVPAVLLPAEWLLPPILIALRVGAIEAGWLPVRVVGLAVGLAGAVLLTWSAVLLGRFMMHEGPSARTTPSSETALTGSSATPCTPGISPCYSGCTKKVSGTLHLAQDPSSARKPKVPDTFFVHRWTFSLLGLLVTGIGLLPVIGRFAAVIVSLGGLKRLSGLDILSTFIFRSAWGFRCSYLRPCSAASCKWTCSVCGNEPSSLTSVAAVDRE